MIEMKNRLTEILKSQKTHYLKKIKSIPELWNWILKESEKSPVKIENDKEKIHFSLTKESPICLNGKRKKFSRPVEGYKVCATNSSCLCFLEKLEESWKDKKEQAKKKREETCLKKYGVKTNLQSEEQKEKSKSISVRKWGVEHHTKSETFKQQQKRNNLEKYGVDHHTKLETFKQQQKRNNLEKYGVDHFMKTDIGKEILSQSNLKKYGVKSTLSIPEIFEKTKRTRTMRYGVENMSHRHITYDSMEILKSKEQMEELSNKYNVFEMGDMLGVGFATIYRYFRKYGIKEKYTSLGEKQLQTFLNTIDIDYITNSRKIIPPFELDIFIPSIQIAIEYCGVYWHSDAAPNYKGDRYHFIKWKRCNELGIRLVTIFEDEWFNNREICENRLRHIFGKNNKICSARNTLIKNIENLEYKNFTDNTHIQGYVSSKIKLGAFFNNKLVAVMGFGKIRKSLGSSDKEGVYELLRFSTIGNIPGIASKLFSKFVKEYKPVEVISYCDLRWGTGNLYQTLGFQQVGITRPNYWYVKSLVREHRFKYRKDILVKQGYDPTRTEKEIMKERGYGRIYDCGNLKFSIKF